MGDERGLCGSLPHLPLGDGQGPVTDYLTGADQNIPDWMIEITLPREGGNCN